MHWWYPCTASCECHKNAVKHVRGTVEEGALALDLSTVGSKCSISGLGEMGKKWNWVEEGRVRPWRGDRVGSRLCFHILCFLPGLTQASSLCACSAVGTELRRPTTIVYSQQIKCSLTPRSFLAASQCSLTSRSSAAGAMGSKKHRTGLSDAIKN